MKLTLAIPVLLALTAPSVAAQVDAHIFRGSLGNDQLGTSVGGAGDVNADGVPDVIVGAIFANAGAPDTGSVFVYSGLDGAELHRFDGDVPNDFLGRSVAGVGDVDGDGHDDVIAGASRITTGSIGIRGYARVYSGSTGQILHQFVGGPGDDTLGHSVDGAGDVDGDGVPDFVVGSPSNNTGGFFAGRAWVYSGATGEVLFAMSGSHPGAYFGFNVAGMGDLNADGHADFAIGAPREVFNGFLFGSVRVYSGLDGSVLQILRGAAVGDGFGTSVANAQDVDGDGTNDLIVGSNSDFTPPSQGSRRVDVISGADGTNIHAFTGPGLEFQFVDNYAPSVAGAGDVDGDGVPDLVIGLSYNEFSGNARVMSGADGKLLYTVAGKATFTRTGFSVGGVGDVDADGLADVVVGSPLDETGAPKGGKVQVVSSGGSLGPLACDPAQLHSGGRSAILHVQGRNLVATNDLVFVADRLPLNQFGMLVVGDAIKAPGPLPGSQGDLCLGGTLGRFNGPGQTGSSGPWGEITVRGVNLNSIPQGGTTAGTIPGQTWHFQLWFRDMNPGPTSNLTNAISITFQ